MALQTVHNVDEHLYVNYEQSCRRRTQIIYCLVKIPKFNITWIFGYNVHAIFIMFPFKLYPAQTAHFLDSYVTYPSHNEGNNKHAALSLKLAARFHSPACRLAKEVHGHCGLG